MPLPISTDLLDLPLSHHASRGVGGFELSVVPHLNGPSATPREILGDRDPRKSLLLQLTDFRVIRWRVSRPP